MFFAINVPLSALVARRRGEDKKDDANRILYEWKLYNDRAIHVINDDHDRFAKEELYRLAFTDPITGNYNWSHLEALRKR